MNVLADMLTALRFMLLPIILYVGVLYGPDKGLATVAGLTILAWVSDVLDGPLARHAKRSTRLGDYDLVADVGLALALVICLVVWGALPFLLVVGGVVFTGLGVRKLQLMLPLQLAMTLAYVSFVLTAWHLAPEWGRTLTRSGGVLMLLNPPRIRRGIRRSLEQVRDLSDRIKIMLRWTK